MSGTRCRGLLGPCLLLLLTRGVALAQDPTPQVSPQPGELAELRARVSALEAQVGVLLERLKAAQKSPPPQDPPEPPGLVQTEGRFPRGTYVPGYPWLRVVDGVLYFQPVAISPELYESLQSYAALQSLLEGVEATASEDRPGLLLAQVPEGHPLAHDLGLQAGDRLVSLNGQPLPATAEEGRRLHEDLRQQRRFALEVLRDGQHLVVAFYVANDEPHKALPAPVQAGLAAHYRLVVASQDPEHPERNSVVLQELRGGFRGVQRTLFVGDELEGRTIQQIGIARQGELTEVTLVVAGPGEEAGRTVRLVRR